VTGAVVRHHHIHDHAAPTSANDPGAGFVGNPQPRGHPCAVGGCLAVVPDGRHLCQDCWRSVPLELREQVWASWRALHEPLGNPIPLMPPLTRPPARPPSTR
jgi:hypothetical protein